jgi:hypothetical protein
MTMMKLLPASACVLAALLAGCASPQQFVHFPNQKVKVEDPTKGRIYVLRPSGMSKASSMEIWDGNTHIGNTAASSYLCWERPPGDAIISGKEENTSTVSFWVATNSVHYVFQHLRMGWVAARNEMEMISEEKALPLLKDCKPPKEEKCTEHPECRGEAPKAK